MTTLSAPQRTVAVTGTVYVRTSATIARTQGEAALAALIRATPIGGNVVNGGARGVFNDDVVRTIWTVPGVARVVLTSSDHTMGQFDVAVGDWTGLNWTAL